MMANAFEVAQDEGMHADRPTNQLTPGGGEGKNFCLALVVAGCRAAMRRPVAALHYCHHHPFTTHRYRYMVAALGYRHRYPIAALHPAQPGCLSSRRVRIADCQNATKFYGGVICDARISDSEISDSGISGAGI